MMMTLLYMKTENIYLFSLFIYFIRFFFSFGLLNVFVVVVWFVVVFAVVYALL